jgi:hypothetical protein
MFDLDLPWCERCGSRRHGFRAAVKTSLADVVPATCSVLSTPRSIHPAFTASNISSAGPVWPFGMPNCSNACAHPARGTAKAFTSRFRTSPNCSATSSGLTIEPSSTTRRPDHVARSEELRPPRQCRSSPPWSISGLSGCSRPVAFRPGRPASRRGSFRRTHLDAQMRLAIFGREPPPARTGSGRPGPQGRAGNSRSLLGIKS